MSVRAALVAVLLAGCATGPTAEQHAEKARTLFGNDCTRDGYRENTDAWNRCVAGAYIRYTDEQNARAAALRASIPPPVLPQIQAPSYGVAPARTCTSWVNGQMVTTTCQ